MKNPPIGLVHEATIHVDETLVVPNLSKTLTAMADMPPVFATAYMVAFMEATCIEALAPYLEAGEGTVGTQVNMSHIAATPIDMAVTAQVELITAKDRKLLFRVVCRDEQGIIGKGLHERFIINRQTFMARTEAKLGQRDERCSFPYVGYSVACNGAVPASTFGSAISVTGEM